MNAKHTLFAACSFASMALFAATSAFAQDASARASNKPSAGRGFIEDIVVTAQKRTQNVQDVPVAISAFSAEMLEARGVANPQDLQQTVPSLSIGEQTNLGGAAKVTLRGVGSENYGPGGDPGVPIHINGHYTQSTAYIFRDMIDVQRVEVQRGPQGTLYGRNAIGGNVNLITRRPTKNFEGSAAVEVGNYGRRMVQAVASGPISDTIRARVVGARAVRDGFVKELGVGKDRDSVDYLSLRGSVEIDITPELQAYINGYYFNDKGSSYTRRIDFDPNNISNTQPFAVKSNTPNENLNRSKGGSFDLTWRTGDVELRSLTAYDQTNTKFRYDVDGTAVRLAEFAVGINMNVFTQELQALSHGDGPLKWVAGAFYYKESSDETRTNVIDRFDTDGNGFTGIQLDLTQPLVYQYSKTQNHASSWAVYGQVDYDLTSKLQVEAGLRYTKDSKDYFSGADTVLSDGSSRLVGTGGGRFTAFPILGQVFFDNRAGTSWSKVTWKAGLNYRVDKNTLLFASWSRGYKAGGYAAKQGDYYNPETVDAFEFGYKNQTADKRFQTNLSLFYYDYKNKQELQFFGPSAQFPNGGLQLINATNAKSYGAELELQAYVTKSLRLDGTFSYLHATYGNFIVKDAQFPLLGFQNLAGHTLPLAPEVKVSVGAQYDLELGHGAGTITARADYSYVSQQWGNALNRTGGVLPATGDMIPAYSQVNARLAWKSEGNRLNVALFAQNLTNTYAISNSFVNGLSEVVQSNLKPRTYGIKVGYNF